MPGLGRLRNSLSVHLVTLEPIYAPVRLRREGISESAGCMFVVGSIRRWLGPMLETILMMLVLGIIPMAVSRNLACLRDAASYITALPEKESAAPEWQAAIEALMLLLISVARRCLPG
jgi:hypothetical protein